MSDQPKIILAYDASAADGDAAAQDVFTQIEAVEAALAPARLTSKRLPVDLNFHFLKKTLTESDDLVVFNLVESLDGVDHLQAAFAIFLESWRTPFTGSGSAAMLMTNHKILAKTLLAERGVPTPDWFALDEDGGLTGNVSSRDMSGLWIIKPLEAHASLFMDDGSVRSFSSAGEMADLLAELRARHGMEFFGERYVDGREFNISLLEGEHGAVRVLPPAEILFEGLDAGKPKIVGYAAKWDEESEEFRKTERVFGTLKDAPELAAYLERLAFSAWQAFGLAGYARVDFRVDDEGRPFFLEANANPCLAPDAGFAAAAAEAGLDFDELCFRIVEPFLCRD